MKIDKNILGLNEASEKYAGDFIDTNFGDKIMSICKGVFKKDLGEQSPLVVDGEYDFDVTKSSRQEIAEDIEKFLKSYFKTSNVRVNKNIEANLINGEIVLDFFAEIEERYVPTIEIYCNNQTNYEFQVKMSSITCGSYEISEFASELAEFTKIEF